MVVSFGFGFNKCQGFECKAAGLRVREAKESERDRTSEREREGERQSERASERETGLETERASEREREGKRQNERARERQRERDRARERERDRASKRERDREGGSGPGEQRAIEEEVALPQRLRALQSERPLSLPTQGSGCRVQGSGFRVQGLWSRVQGSGFRGGLAPAPAHPVMRSTVVSTGVPR